MIRKVYIFAVCFLAFLNFTSLADAQVNNFVDIFPDDQKNTVVFIPGILGSKIVVDGDVIWGSNNFNSEKLFYDDTTNTSNIITTPLSHIDANKLLKIKRVVYGRFLNRMSFEYQESDNFIPLSYDWRSSNRKSAKTIDDMICEKKLENKNGVIFVAHSMGGLVLKHWLRDHYENGCDGKKLNITSIVYVATPHLGSPKVLWSFINGPELHWLPIVDNYISRGLLKYGATFDSSYELIPAELAYKENFSFNNLCISPKIKKYFIDRKRTSFKQTINGENSVPSDIFNVQRWNDFGITPRFKNDLGERFDSEYLQEKLNNARENICRIANFVAPEDLKDKVYFLHGRQKISNSQLARKTIESISVNVSDGKDKASLNHWNEEKQKYYNFNLDMGFGDETVPTISGSMGRCSQSCRTNDTDANHEEIMEGIDLNELIHEIQIASIRDDDFQKEALKKYAKSSFEEGKYNFGTILNSEFGATWETIYADAAFEVASKKYPGLATGKAYKSIQSRNDVIGMIALSSADELTSTRRAWLLNNAGFLAYNAGHIDYAIGSLEKAIEFSEEIEAQEAKNKLQSKARNTLGLAYRNQGRIEEAKEMIETSAKLGNARAIKNLQKLSIFQFN